MEYWDKIVVLHLKEQGSRSLSVKDSKHAAWLLLNWWPDKRGKSYRRAVLNCSAALRGQGPNDIAQWSFVVAAMEAAISYEVMDRFDTEIAAICRELLEDEEMLREQSTPATGEGGVMQPFWWPRRQVSGPPAR